MAKVTLAGARVSAGLTQQELADKLGVSRCSVANWESGKTEIRTATFIAFCHVTGFDRDDILLPIKSA